MNAFRSSMRIAFAFIAAALLAGCSVQASGPASSSVSTDGSTSMEKVIGCLKEAYEADNPRTTITFNPTGSGSGITAAAEGRCDLGLSSRPLQKKEADQGLEEVTIAYDGIVLIVHPDNPVSDLDLETIRKMFTGELDNWSQAGGKPSPIVLCGREAGSGTRSGFEEATGTKNACRLRRELTSSGDIIASVMTNPNAIGYVSAASVKEGVKVLRVEGVLPTDESIADGSYKIRRDFNVVKKADQPLSDSAQKFFDYITSPRASLAIESAGVLPAVRKESL